MVGFGETGLVSGPAPLPPGSGVLLAQLPWGELPAVPADGTTPPNARVGFHLIVNLTVLPQCQLLKLLTCIYRKAQHRLFFGFSSSQLAVGDKLVQRLDISD